MNMASCKTLTLPVRPEDYITPPHKSKVWKLSLTRPSVDTRAFPQMKYCVSVDYTSI